jgi:tetratricopeptide (TPR) repeat protein
MSVIQRCPFCGGVLPADLVAAHADRVVACPHCGTSVELPEIPLTDVPEEATAAQLARQGSEPAIEPAPTAESSPAALEERRPRWKVLAFVLAAVLLAAAACLAIYLFGTGSETRRIKVAAAPRQKKLEARSSAAPLTQNQPGILEKESPAKVPETPSAGSVKKETAASVRDLPEVPADDWQELLKRAEQHVQARQWQKAAEDFAAALRLHPQEHWHWFRSAGLWVWLNDRAAYRRHCEEMLRRWGETTNVVLAERTAKACLLAPDAVADMTPVFQLADRGVTGTEAHSAYRWFLLARGLAHYRAGEFDQALERLRKSVAPDRALFINAAGLFITAMAHERLGQTTQAREALAKGREILEQEGVPTLESGELGPGWHDWLNCQILRREAESLIEAGKRQSKINQDGKGKPDKDEQSSPKKP